MLAVWEICKTLWEQEKVRPTFWQVVPEEVALATLMVASMFHDFGHSGGRRPDRENIQLAIRKIKHFVLVESDVLNKVFKKKYPDDWGYLLWGSISIVDVTEFPFVKQPQGMLECIMRDADVLYAAMSNKPELIMEDLRKEMEVYFGHGLHYNVMLEGQWDFMQKAVMYTESGKALFAEHAPAYYEQMKDYVELQRS